MKPFREFITDVDSAGSAMFNNIGSLQPMYHVVKRNGQEFAIMAPSTNKDATMAIMRVAFKGGNVRRYAFISEAWVGRDKAAEQHLRQHGTLATLVGRDEVVIISAEDENEGQQMTQRKIIREADTAPRLGPLEWVDMSMTIEGRMVGLLPGKGRLQ